MIMFPIALATPQPRLSVNVYISLFGKGRNSENIIICKYAELYSRLATFKQVTATVNLNFN